MWENIKLDVNTDRSPLSSDRVTRGHPITTVNQNHPVTIKKRTFNNSIAIMLRSYTGAINKQNNRSGILFRNHTKAECVNCRTDFLPSFIRNHIDIIASEKQYPQICFEYIHNNPVRAGLVKNAVGWKFSSMRDYTDLRKIKLINKKIVKEYIDF